MTTNIIVFIRTELIQNATYKELRKEHVAIMKY